MHVGNTVLSRMEFFFSFAILVYLKVDICGKWLWFTQAFYFLSTLRAKFNLLVHAHETTILTNYSFKKYRGEVWRYVTKSQQSFLTERSICMRTMEENMDYRFVLERNQAQENHECQFFSFFLPYFQDHALLGTKNLATMLTWLNDFSPLFSAIQYPNLVLRILFNSSLVSRPSLAL